MGALGVPCKGAVVPSASNPTRLTFAPAGSTWGGPVGNKWAEAPQEKASLGGQRALRAAMAYPAISQVHGFLTAGR